MLDFLQWYGSGLAEFWGSALTIRVPHLLLFFLLLWWFSSRRRCCHCHGRACPCCGRPFADGGGEPREGAVTEEPDSSDADD